MKETTNSTLAGARRRTAAHAGLFASVAWLLAIAAPALAQDSPLVILTSVQVLRDGQKAIVTIEADGPLPPPTTGTVESPPRFFLDFPGVIAGTRGTSGTAGSVVSRVRVALHSSTPAVTRVVIDLAQPQPVQVDAAAGAAGRLRIVVGGAVEAARLERAATAREPKTPGIRPVPPLPPEAQPVRTPPAESAGRPATPAGPPAESPTTTTAQPQPAAPAPPIPPAPRPSTAVPPAASTTAETPRRVPPDLAEPPAVYPAGPSRAGAKPEQRDIDRYRDDVAVPLNRLRTRRTLLTLIDQQESRPPDGLPAARAEFSAVIRALSGVRPAPSMLPTHDLLVRAASLALMAATLRDDTGGRADPTVLRNASSAAAGALLLMDRVCIEIGCGPLSEAK
jgi:hypothetical protein